MRQFDVVISDQAEQDLRGIYEYIAFELLSPENAAGQLSRLEKAILRLDSFPEKHRQYEEEPWQSRNLRMLPIDNYVVFYIPDNDGRTVTVLRVIYGGRDMKTQLSEHTEI